MKLKEEILSTAMICQSNSLYLQTTSSKSGEAIGKNPKRNPASLRVYEHVLPNEK